MPLDRNTFLKTWRQFLKPSEDVFYLPSFGPIYTHGEDYQSVLGAVLDYEENRNILPYDKDIRWETEKQEFIHASAARLGDLSFYLPVVNLKTSPNLKVYFYSDKSFRSTNLRLVSDIQQQVNQTYRIHKTRVITFQKPALDLTVQRNNLYLKVFTPEDKLSRIPSEICFFEDIKLRIQQTLSLLGENSELGWAEFLQNWALEQPDPADPVLIAIEDEKIAGVIGPLQIMQDAWGTPFMPAPYFGIDAKYRQQGIGKKLWQAAMDWGYRHGAQYKLLQAAAGEPADYFYKKLSLEVKQKLYTLAV